MRVEDHMEDKPLHFLIDDGRKLLFDFKKYKINYIFYEANKVFVA